MQVAATPGLEVMVDWQDNADVTDRVQRKVNRLLRSIGPVLNEYEACLYDMATLASNGLDYLMPKVELTLPLYEEKTTFRVRMKRLEATEIHLVTEDGVPVAEVHLT